MNKNEFTSIEVIPGYLGGKPFIKGTGVRVSEILDLLLAGISRKGILREYPGICNHDIDSAVSFLEAKLEMARQSQYTHEKVS
ncbi:DUF433 domain-containing protein [Leptospira interrogans]|uniref:PF04255 family protein n=22 Tax=Leptospira interrogans TaxID=173 RepID=Q8F9M8_LEPIN|nr:MULTISPECIES: DUF433 domain-containing protein [Leptospira]EMF43567.1 PF04255 family protein [Leptospira interrogans serovar Lora str. TE 1992]EMF71996.1 PF04255 family protein [Leptospira interrogans serovar Canicola str. LT1962]EMG09458.1 PF04255 family protein [Leptospira interrogans serovar Grippotyphosa str. LT2186]EMG22733.1 PF04255 family protein [Leptospira interrogans serovar Copenhageni str. LT2050]EMM83353.1 PF04255 family protein [Leptospira interrogans str. 2006001854]EMM93747